jgi:hypothetical protein
MSTSDEPTPPPEFALPARTLVQEREGDIMLSFDGLLVLPLGARINLDNLPELPAVPLDPELFPNGHADAIVVGIYLRGTQGAEPALVLEVELAGPTPHSAPLAEAAATDDVVEAAEQIARGEDGDAPPPEVEATA